MLVRLEIKNFAVISHAVFEPNSGFNSITGETGAGKSLLIDAIGLILGQKASKNLIRTDSDEAFVEAVFDVSDVNDDGLVSLLKDSGIDVEDSQLIISRKITRDGKSIARVNGRTVVLAVLKAISSFLVDIHGQHDTQAIFDENCHIDMLDSFGGQDIVSVLSEYRTCLASMKEVVLKIRQLSISPDELTKRRDYLKYAVNEINNASLTSGEEDSLMDLNKSMKILQKNSSYLTEIDDYFNGEDSSGLSVSSRISNAYKVVNKLIEANADESNSKIIDIAEKLSKLMDDSETISALISNFVSSDGYDKDKQEQITSRLGLIYDLKAKYSCKSVDELIDFSYKAEDELQSLENNGKLLVDLKKKRSEIEVELLSIANKLSQLRKTCAEKLSTAITSELKDLEMPDARFEVRIEKRNKEKFFSNKGVDVVTFLFSANPGQEMRSLAQTASGGEASRIMLAIKNVLSEADLIPTLVFDEIDTGVSGSASISIARKLQSISKHHQVLCVTHTAQLAAASNTSHFISKSVVDNSTLTSIKILDEQEKTNEVSRLLSGTDATRSIELAKELISSFSV